MHSFTVDIGGPTHAVDFGGNGEPLLLVHGLGGSVANWTDLGPRLRSVGRVLAVDLPGFGRTPPAGRSAHIDHQQAFLARFIAAVIGEPATLVGNSMGGLIAMLEAARRPEQVKRLALLDPAAPAPSALPSIDPSMMLLSVGSMIPPLGRAALRALDRSMTPAQRVTESFSIIAGDPTRIRAATRAEHVAVAAERRTQPWGHAAFLEAYRSVLTRLIPRRFDEVVDRITTQTLLVHGTADRIVPYAAARRLADRRPDWTFHTLEGGGHVPMLEQPGDVADLLTDFVIGKGARAA